MTKSERCELVLNALFYWEPMEFFQKRSDMTTLGVFIFIYYYYFFKISGAALFWIFGVRAICSSATPAKVALQWFYLDMIMDATRFSVELLDGSGRIEAILLSARNVVRQRQRQRLLMFIFIDSLVKMHCTAKYVTVL